MKLSLRKFFQILPGVALLPTWLKLKPNPEIITSTPIRSLESFGKWRFIGEDLGSDVFVECHLELVELSERPLPTGKKR